MMGRVTINREAVTDADSTSVSNIFIDEFMTEANDAQPTEEAPKRDVPTPTDDPVPSRMTDEYIAWMKAQREATDAENNRAPFETEQ